MKIFISGGCKNGKSYYAQHLAKTQQGDKPLYYIATMKPVDGEDDERILRHRYEREGWGFETVEQPIDIEKIIDKCDCSGSFLLDSLTALLANEMFMTDGGINKNAAEKIINGLTKIVKNETKNIVIVSDYIYSDAFIYDEFTEKYRKSLAEIDCEMAKMCDIVIEVTFTNVIVHKGKVEFKGLYEKIY